MNISESFLKTINLKILKFIPYFEGDMIISKRYVASFYGLLYQQTVSTNVDKNLLLVVPGRADVVFQLPNFYTRFNDRYVDKIIIHGNVNWQARLIQGLPNQHVFVICQKNWLKNHHNGRFISPPPKTVFFNCFRH